MAYEKSFSVDVTTEEYVQAIDWVKNDYDSDGYEVEVKIQFPCLDILHIITEILKDGGMLNGETTRVFAENDERGVINLNQVS